MTNGEVQAMYLLFRHNKIKPSEYYDMLPGEKIICRAFVYKEVEDMQREYEALGGEK
jgi:hypothetical protein